MLDFFSHLRRALPYILWPLCATGAWISTVLGLLIFWTGPHDAKRYRSDDQTILYISDVGSANQTLFITGAVLTAFFWYKVSKV